jgi:hypothetical protein
MADIECTHSPAEIDEDVAVEVFDCGAQPARNGQRDLTWVHDGIGVVLPLLLEHGRRSRAWDGLRDFQNTLQVVFVESVLGQLCVTLDPNDGQSIIAFCETFIQNRLQP